MGRVDQVLVGRAGRLEARVDTGPVVGVVAVVVETGAVLDRRRDPYRGEAEVANVVQTLDEALEVAPPVGVVRCPAVKRMRSRQKKLLVGSPS